MASEIPRGEDPRDSLSPNNTDGGEVGNTGNKNLNIICPTARLEIKEIVIREGRQNLLVPEERLPSICEKALDRMVRELEESSQHPISPARGDTGPEAGPSQGTNPGSACEVGTQSPKADDGFGIDDMPSHDGDGPWDDQYFMAEFNALQMANFGT